MNVLPQQFLHESCKICWNSIIKKICKFNKYGVILFVGNIGAGKTTILHNLKKIMKADVVFIEENLIFIIGLFSLLKNKKINIIQFQCRIVWYYNNLNVEISEHIKNRKTIIMERSNLSAIYIFALRCFLNKEISLKQFEIIENSCNEPLLPIKLIFYINVNPYLCSVRQKVRNRYIDKDTPIWYTVQLHILHSIMFYSIKNIPVVIVNGSHNEKEVMKEIIKYCPDISYLVAFYYIEITNSSMYILFIIFSNLILIFFLIHFFVFQ